jgi:NAD(P)-dependent dehydrogenase (short-subunit alcohol dehydrogenase family)
LEKAASGIGKETAFALAEAGVEAILLADLNEPSEITIEECRKYSRLQSFRAVAVQADITDETSVARMVETAVREFGRVDYCVHAAGVSDEKRPEPSNLGISFSTTSSVCC